MLLWNLRKLLTGLKEGVAMSSKGIQKVLVSSVMSLYEGAETRVREDSELSEELEFNVRCAVTFSFCIGGRFCH